MSGTVPPDPTPPDTSGVPDDSDPDLLRALERVDADLAALRDAPAPPIPDDVAARLDATLREAHPTRKRTNHVGRWILTAAAAVALFAGVAGIAALREDASAPVPAAAPDLDAVPGRHAVPGHETVPSREPTFDPAAGTTPDLLARALRGSSVDAGPLADPEALSQCLHAGGETGPVVGALRVNFDARPSALVVVADPQSGALTAVVVGQTCTAEDPQILARTALG